MVFVIQFCKSSLDLRSTAEILFGEVIEYRISEVFPRHSVFVALFHILKLYMLFFFK
jgi:hypothetical protein